jgi:hypothetical protein
LTFIFYKIFCLFIHASTLLLIDFLDAFGSLGALGSLGSLGALGSLGVLGALGALGSLGTTDGVVAEVEVDVDVDVDVDEDVDEELELEVVIISPIEPKLVVDMAAAVAAFLGVFKEMRSFFGETNSPII